MELYVPEYAYYVVELWQEFITRLINLLLSRELEENVSGSVLPIVNETFLLAHACCNTVLKQNYRARETSLERDRSH